MTEDEWGAAWPVLVGSWPNSQLAQGVVKAEWRVAFERCDADAFVAAVRRHAQEADRAPSIAELSAYYTAERQRQARKRETPRIPAPPETEDEWEARYQANLVATQRQMVHEANCQDCAEYARTRKGAPCPVGGTYWQPHWAAGMPRPTA